MRYVDALAIFEMAVELFAVCFCVSYLFRMHKDKPLYVALLLSAVFCLFFFHPVLSLLFREWHLPEKPARTAMMAAMTAGMVDILWEAIKKKKAQKNGNVQKK